MTTETNGLSKKREQTCQRIIEALQESKGLLTLAAHKAGVSYSTVKRYATEFPTVREAVQDAKESMLDFTESKLYEKIKFGDTACLIFYLKTQAKHRGYVERQEVTGEGGKAIKLDITPQELTDEQLAVIAATTIIHNARNGSDRTSKAEASTP